jgi:hypothetical protein
MFVEEKVLLGRDREIVELPAAVWKEQLTKVPSHMQPRLGFMTEAHHQVRYFVVRELVDTGKPISAEMISERLNLPLEQVKVLLEELERKLFFLVRGAGGAVVWAYPMTVEPTPHRLNFSTGERLFGA